MSGEKYFHQCPLSRTERFVFRQRTVRLSEVQSVEVALEGAE